MKRNLMSLYRSTSHLIFPEKCLNCEEELIEKESYICEFCANDLSYTHFENLTESSRMDKLFWGRIPIFATYSLLNFEGNTVTQKIIHALKYENNIDIGKKYGRELGDKINSLSTFQNLDALIPVPIHPKKKFIRGYNQAEVLAKGISEKINVPVIQHGILKTKHTESQTRKSMWERWQNSENVFSSTKSLDEFQHVALVDDVLTTGATLERLANILMERNTQLKISFITLAITK